MSVAPGDPDARPDGQRLGRLLPSMVMIWTGQTTPSGWLIIGGGVFYLYIGGCDSAPARLWWAWHRAQELRAAAAGGQ